MFLDTSGFKKLIKEAWKRNCLILSRMDGSILMTNGAWCLVSDMAMIPNKIKGAIIELTGGLPEEGESFQAGKDGNQYKIIQTIPWDAMRSLNDTADEAIRAEQTRILIDEVYTISRVLKYKTASFYIQKQFTDLITCDELIEGKETSPEGPYIYRNPEDGVIGAWWTNWTGVFLVLEIESTDDWHKKLLDYCTSQEVGIKK